MARTTSFTSSPRARRTRVVVRVGRRVERMVDQSAVRTLSARSLASAGSSRAASKAGSPPSFFASLAVAPASANAAFSGFEMGLGVGAPRVERCSRSSASLTACATESASGEAADALATGSVCVSKRAAASPRTSRSFSRATGELVTRRAAPKSSRRSRRERSAVTRRKPTCGSRSMASSASLVGTGRGARASRS